MSEDVTEVGCQNEILNSTEKIVMLLKNEIVLTRKEKSSHCELFVCLSKVRVRNEKNTNFHHRHIIQIR